MWEFVLAQSLNVPPQLSPKKLKVVMQRKTANSSTRSTRVIIDRRTRRTRTTTESSLVSAYVAEVPLKPAKVKDLLKIANKFLPVQDPSI